MLQYNLWSEDISAARQDVLISQVSLHCRVHYNSFNYFVNHNLSTLRKQIPWQNFVQCFMILYYNWPKTTSRQINREGEWNVMFTSLSNIEVSKLFLNWRFLLLLEHLQAPFTRRNSKELLGRGHISIYNLWSLSMVKTNEICLHPINLLLSTYTWIKGDSSL
jgi:hypothetical protein